MSKQSTKKLSQLNQYSNFWLVITICVAGFLIGAVVVMATVSFAQSPPTDLDESRWYERVATQVVAVWSVIAQTSQQVFSGVPLQIAQVGSASPVDVGDMPLTATDFSMIGSSAVALTGTLRINTPLQVDDSFEVLRLTKLATTSVTGPLDIATTLTVGGDTSLTSLTVRDAAILSTLGVANNTTLNTVSVTGVATMNSLSVQSALSAGSFSVAGRSVLATLGVTGEADVASLSVAGNTFATGLVTALGGIVTEGANINLGDGSLFAANVVNQIIAGDNVVITGTQNQPIISVDTDGLIGVLSINNQTGNINLFGGSDISVSGLSITNTSNLASVRSRGGCVGCITDADVSPILTILGGSINNTIIGEVTAASARFSDVAIGTTTSSTTLSVGGAVSISDVLTVSGTATSTFSGSVNITSGCFAINGVCIEGASPSSYVSLSDTPGSLIAGALQFGNASGTALTQSASFVFDGVNLSIGTDTPLTRLTVAGDGSILSGSALRWYNPANTNYVGFRASNALATSTVWTLPVTDGANNQLLVTDGNGTLRFADVSAIGGGSTTYLQLTDTPGTFATGTIPFVNASSNALTQSSSFVYRDGNLGVGIANPSTRLAVQGGVRIQLSSAANQLGLTYGAVGNRFGFGTDSPSEFVTIQHGSLNQRGGTATTTYQPATVASLPLSGNVNDIDIAGSYAYAVSGSSGNNFFVIDISNPTGPVVATSIALPSGALSVRVSGKYAYVGGTFAGDGFYIVDITNPLNPVVVNSIVVPTDVRSIIVSGQYAYLAIGNTVRVWDMSNPVSPVEVTSVTVTDNINSLALSGTYLYAVSAIAGNHFHVINISNPLAISIVANLNFGAAANDVVIRGGYAYVATSDGANTLRIININTPASPVPVTSLSLGTTGNVISITGRYAYVGTQAVGNTFYVIDVLSPTMPQLVGSNNLNAGNLLGMSIKGRYAYVTSSNVNDRLHVVDLTGAEFQSAMAHSLEGGYLTVQGDTQIGGRIVAGLGLRSGSEGLQTDGLLSVLGTGTSQIAGRLSIGTSSSPYQLTVAGNVGITGALYDSFGNAGGAGMVLQSNSTSTRWVATSTLGLSSQSLTLGSSNQIPFMNGAGTDLNYSSNFTFNGSALNVNGNILPGTNLSFSLGSASNRYSHVWAETFNIGTSTWSVFNGENGRLAISDAGAQAGTERLSILTNGNVGIGTTTPGERLTVSGRIQSSELLGVGVADLETDSFGNIIRGASDERLKQNVVVIENALAIVMGLRGVRYEWIDTDRFGTQTEVGFLAQEVQVVLPEAVREGEEYWSLRTANIVAVVVEAVKELWSQLRGTQADVAALRARIEVLESQLEEGLESSVIDQFVPSLDSEYLPDSNEEEGIENDDEDDGDSDSETSVIIEPQEQSESLPTDLP